MFNRIVNFSIHNRIIIILAYLLIFIYGYQTITHMSVDVFPDLNRPSVTLIVEAGGLAPDELEKQVTIPIENAINGATNVTRVFSTSSIGYAVIKAEFDWDMNIYTARQIINERLSQLGTRLPANTQVVMGPVSSIMGEILIVGLSSPDNSVNAMQLRDIADWDIKKRLLSIPGVSQVSTLGGDVKEYQVIVDTNQLRLNNVSLDKVREALTNSGSNTNGGFILETYTEKLIRNLGLVKTIADIENTILPVTTSSNAPSLTIKQIAEVKAAPQINPRGQANINGSNGVILSISKQPNVDTIELTQKLESELQNIAASLPQGIVLTSDLFRQANFINLAVENIEEALGLGSLLIAIVLFAFLVNFRTTAIVLLVIPTSFVMTGIVFKALGLSINTMTLGGLAMAIGSLVDDAIVAVANCFKRIKENKHSEHPLPLGKIVYLATTEIINSVIFSTVLVFLVFIPLFALSGIEGKIFAPLALAFILSMLASMIVAITLTPVLSYYFIPSLKVLDRPDSLVVRTFKHLHQISLEYCFQHYKKVLAFIMAAFIAGLFLVMSFGREFLPPFNEGSFNVSLTMAPGTSLEESNRIHMIAQQRLLEIPEIKSIGGRSGRSEVDEHALGVNTTEMEIEIKDDSSRHKDEIVADMREKLNFPGVFINIGQPISHRIDFIISGIRSQIAVKIFGDDLDVLRQQAEQVKEVMGRVKGVVDLSVEQQIMVPQVHIEIDREKAKRFGIMAGNISRDVETSLAGETISSLIEGDRFYDIVLRLNDASRTNLKAIGSIPIESINGYFAPLNAVAKIRDAKGPNQITRENGKRRIVVQANISGRDLVGTVEDIQAKLSQELKLPAGYFLSFDGQFETQAQASRDIALLGILAFTLIFVGLYIYFQSLNLSLQLMTVVPLSLIGAIIGIAISSRVISIATIVGFITLIGIAIRNGILLIDLYQTRQKEQPQAKLSVEQLIFLTKERLVPVMMTSLTAILGFVPLIVGGNAAGKEILYPAAVVIASGLISSTLLNLLITPVMYYYFYERKIDNAD